MDLRQRVEEQLARLDGVLDQLRDDLDALRDGRPADVQTVAGRMQAAHELDEQVRECVRQAAAEVDLSLPTPPSRAELLQAVERIRAREAELARAAEHSRQRLAELEKELAAGTLTHRRQARKEHLEGLRARALEEVRAAREGPRVPPLAEPPAEPAGPWLAAALRLKDPELSAFLEGLGTAYPHLGTFLADLDDPGWWLPTGTSAPAERAPEEVPLADVSGSDGSPGVPTSDEAPGADEDSPRLADASGSDGPPEPLPETDEPAPTLEDELASFPAFRLRHWIGPNGACERAPWTADDFPQRLEEAARDELGACRFFRLWVFVRALEECAPHPPPLSSTVIEALADLWDHPDSASSGSDPLRATRLALAAEERRITDSPGWKWELFLEAVRPGRDESVLGGLAREAVRQAGFRDRVLRRLVQGLLEVNAWGYSDPVGQLRAQLRAVPPESPEQIESQLRTRRAALHGTVKRLWSAAGGELERTHCRLAWDAFIGEVAPTMAELYPPEHGGHPEWDPGPMARRLGTLLRREAEIADDRDVKFQDRRRMDRAARDILDAADHVNRLMGQLRDSRRAGANNLGNPLPVDEARRLIAGGPLAQPDEEFCRRLLVRLLRPGEEGPAEAARNGQEDGGEEAEGLLSASWQDLCDHPDLLTLLDPAERTLGPEEEEVPSWALRQGALADPTRAAAILLSEPSEEARGQNAQDLWQVLRRGRPDLLGCLAPGPAARGRSFGPEMNQAHRAREEMLARAHDVLGEVRRHWRDLDDLAAPIADPLRQVSGAAEQLLNEEESETAGPTELCLLREPGLVLGWLEALADLAGRARRSALAGLRRRLKHELPPTRREEALRALAQGAYSRALSLLTDPEATLDPATDGEDGAWRPRETLWRWEAATAFPGGLRDLDRIDAPPAPLDAAPPVGPGIPPGRDGEEGGPGKGATAIREAELLRAWRRGITGKAHQTDRNLRSSFVKFVLGDARPTAGRAGKRRPGGPTLFEQGEDSPTQFRLSCQTVRDHLAANGLNPSFFPQLADLGNLVVVTPPVDPFRRSFVTEVADLLGRQHEPTDLVVVLAPKISARVRRETLEEFRKRRRPAALLDDLDLCRLLNPTGRRPHLVPAFLELLFEQQRWTAFNPFATPQGQHVRMETFVGRAREAELLARTADYSRLFSGRKLGKSALLKAIERTLADTRLPSGNTLRVLYVQIAGAESETDVVARIVAHMGPALRWDAPAADPGEDPGRHLTRICERFLDERPEESLLVILDEADVFVEAQLEEYERSDNREGSLSFRMRGDLQGRTDARGLPRVRFLFSGYRATHTTGGAWGNWGQCLYLAPLRPDEAASLVAGPLARLGIDTTRQAPGIAYRCGHQPAVLLTFGRHLLERLEQTRPPALREAGAAGPTVTADDVAEAFNLPRVQAEVREVVWQNFQGNRAGRVIFFALLEAFADLPPGAPLHDAEQQVLDRLAPFGPTDWLDPSEAPLQRVGQELRDLVDRQLLVEKLQPGGVASYRLRFPHHLGILLAQDPEGVLRQEIALLRERGAGGPVPGTVRALLPPTTMHNLREVIRNPRPPDFPVRAAVVGSHWPEGVGHRSGGVPDRLGIEPAAVLAPGGEEALLSAPCLVVCPATPKQAEEVLARRAEGLPPPLLLGGADLLRWALRRPAEELVEVASLGRLSLPVLRWWFERVLALEFPQEVDGSDAVSVIASATGGIPLLVRALAGRLLGDAVQGGFNVGAEPFRHAIAGFRADLPETAALLRPETESPWSALERRELEILHMVAAASRANDHAALELDEHLSEVWDLYKEHCPGVRALDRSDRADRAALLVIQHLGLVPVHPARNASLPFERQVSVTAEDPLLQLLEHLPLE